MMCRLSFAVTGLYSGMFWAKKDTFDAIGGFAEKKAMEVLKNDPKPNDSLLEAVLSNKEVKKVFTEMIKSGLKK